MPNWNTPSRRLDIMKTRYAAIFKSCLYVGVGLMATGNLLAEDDLTTSSRAKTKGHSASERSADSTRDWGERREAIGDIQAARELLGATVRASDGEKVGHLKNVVVDLESGRVLYVVLAGAGKGEGEVAVPPGLFERSEETGRWTIASDAKEISEAPKFSLRLESTNLGQASFVHKVHEHFGEPAWWQGAKPADEGAFKNVHAATELPGMRIKNVADQDMGEVRDVVLDLSAGRVPFVVLAPRSDLELNRRVYAMPPDALTLSADGKHLVSDIDREKLVESPSLNRNNLDRLSEPAFAASIYRHYGKDAYFENNASKILTPTGRGNRGYQDEQNETYGRPRNRQDVIGRDPGASRTNSATRNRSLLPPGRD
jgi:sporulation protein YlmC with PRC-barrel domain